MRNLHSNRFWAAARYLIPALYPLCAWTQVQPPESLVLDGVPPIPIELKERAGRYLEFRAATFNGWHPQRREILIATRFADTPQLHHVRMPGGARRQLTFLSEPVAGGSYRPVFGDFIVLAQDVGGGEFYQLFRLEPGSGLISLLTDGKSRNMGASWAPSGRWLAYTSTRRTGRDNDVYLMDPAKKESDRLACEVTGGGWSVQDWSRDEQDLVLGEYFSINKSHLHLLDLKSGRRMQITPESAEPVAYGGVRFARDNDSLFVTSDRGSEFRRLVQVRLPAPGVTVGEPMRVLSEKVSWDIDDFELTKDGKLLAYVANENGVGVLHVVETKTGRERRLPRLPTGLISALQWHENNRDLGFSLSSARSPSDVFSINMDSGKLERWTESETGGLDSRQFVEPELVRVKSFDGLEISAFVYRPDSRRFPGKRPVLINIHGGPEAQSRPGFQARNNYFMNELGIMLVYPNVRGSSGFGKTYLMRDNGFKREDSVRDIGTIIDWLQKDPGVAPDRLGVIGGSYGGYMVLASLIHFGDRLRCGVDVVGISSFLTFLKNTQDYRRDLRRAEYGDERDPAMRDFLEKISPTTNVRKIKKPLLVVQGKNDPRVPVTESEQMVKAIRENGGTVWYLMAKDEGHGFGKKQNADFQFLTTIRFLQEYLLPGE